MLVPAVDDGEAEALVIGALECCVTKDVKVTGAQDGFVWVVEGNTYYFRKIRIKKVVRKRYRTDVVVEEVSLWLVPLAEEQEPIQVYSSSPSRSLSDR